ncbi:hypothetical protein BDQ17DRAFT_1332622 [Cyathus striatus]|nr:hypothetical protein BDQ17DRAFT_1332622 [Cyathus striatus]
MGHDQTIIVFLSLFFQRSGGAGLNPSSQAQDHRGFIGVDALVNFVNTLDPNLPKHNNSVPPSIHWPLYNSSINAPPLLTFFDPAPSVNITTDNFRALALTQLMNISLQLHPA